MRIWLKSVNMNLTASAPLNDSKTIYMWFYTFQMNDKCWAYVSEHLCRQRCNLKVKFK